MNSTINAAARALAAGDPLGALKHIALRDDASALALRGIAMAQLGDHERARTLLRRAARAFGPTEAAGRARCVVADAEVALAMRELGRSPRALTSAAAILEARGDRANAAQARLIVVRRLLLLGRTGDAAQALQQLDRRGLPPTLLAVAGLAAAEVALRALRTADAEAALTRAAADAARSGVPALVAEVGEARAALDRPAARRVRGGDERLLRLAEVEALLGADALVVDGCRHVLRAGAEQVSLARRTVLFALAAMLGEAWPGDVERNDLIELVFRTRRPDDSHRARLRVEMGRLRRVVAPMAAVEATAGGFRLTPHGEREVIVLKPPIDGEQGSLLALLADGAAWSTSALALALGTHQRSVQRALAELERAGRVRSIGRARAQRWLAPPLVGFTTMLLLPGALSSR